MVKEHKNAQFDEKPLGNKKVLRHLRTIGWFLFGAVLGLFFFISFVFIYFKVSYADVVYPGVYIDNIDFGGKSPEFVKEYFAKKNAPIEKTTFLLKTDDLSATASARELDMGYDDELLSEQAFLIGRSDNTISNISLIFQAYMHGVYLEPSYTFSDATFGKIIQPFKKAINKEPVDAQFNFQGGKVTTFKPSTNGEKVDEAKLKKNIETKGYVVLQSQKPDAFTLTIPKTIAEPKVTTEKVNNLGIKELIGSGSSVYHGSIPNRIFNINLASSKLNGVLIPPGETFSFVKTIGDVSKLTGYKEAYVIENGRTVLGDGGGLCQVSTTLFRAALNTGLPIVQRNPHAYRVHYYEDDLGPGIDAAVYVPTVDFKFKNDTKHHILIQTIVDPTNEKLTFEMYGTSDGRIAKVGQPVITSQSPAPSPTFQDDPTLPKGEVKQVDWAAPGATVYFTRTVEKDGKTIIDEKFTSRYRPWQAIYLKGTKEG
jgi:vancomycin resistance protein YoaR